HSWPATAVVSAALGPLDGCAAGGSNAVVPAIGAGRGRLAGRGGPAGRVRWFARSATVGRAVERRRNRIALGEIRAADGERDTARYRQRPAIRPAGGPVRGRAAADPRLPEYAHGRLRYRDGRSVAGGDHGEPALRPARLLPSRGVQAGEGNPLSRSRLAEPALGRLRPRRPRGAPPGRSGRAPGPGRRAGELRGLDLPGRVREQDRLLARAWRPRRVPGARA